MPQNEGGGTGTGAPRERLVDAIQRWKELDARIKEWVESGDPTKLAEVARLRAERRDSRVRIMNILGENPGLADVAENQGFDYRGFDPDDYEQGGQTPDGAQGTSNSEPDASGSSGGGGGGNAGGSGGNKGGGGGGSPGGAHGPGWKLPGVKGKDFEIVRGPKGSYVAVYKMKIGGNIVSVGVRLPRNKDELAKYGVKPGDAKTLNKEQFKRIHSMGWADELQFHGEDRNPFQALKRSLRRQYGGQPIVDDDEVMELIIANSIYGWTPGEFENQLRNTKWYSKTNEYQRDWELVTSPEQKKETIQQFQQRVVNQLEDHFGLDWTQHIEGGMKKARQWAETIASGKWGEPGVGFEFWSNRMFDRAADIEGTPAWITNQTEQENQQGFLNRPEEKFEQLRAEAMRYLGQRDGKPLIDGETLRTWATDLVTQKRTDADWQQFLRHNLKRLHPYFDENVAFTDQATAYKSVAEGLLGTTLSWDDPLLQRGFQGTDDSGKPLKDQAMSLHDYEMMLRDPEKNPRAWQEGTRLWDEGMSFVAQLEQVFRGVA